MNKLILLLLFLAFHSGVRAQSTWIFFYDKGTTESIDSNVYAPYLDELKENGYKIIGTSKWFNAAIAEGEIIGPLPFESVKGVKRMQAYRVDKAMINEIHAQDSITYGKADVGIQMLKLDDYHRMGFTGKGVTLALFDAGFHNVDTLKAFNSLWTNHRIKAWYDFVDNDETVFDGGSHGTAVLSLAGGNYPDSFTGAAPDVSLVLLRTEDAGNETHMEELNWVNALEWADSVGVDIIHSSLGYSVFDTLEGDYTYANMDGETTIITQATKVAIEKGIFVTNSAGNEGAKEWKYITAPCDGEGVLCVGAVDSFRVKAGFSSFGPSADGRVKPEVMAMGKRIHYIGSDGIIRSGNGTSLSGPLIAGMVACLKQAWPDVPNDTIFNAILRSADRYANPDTAYGYGIPNVLTADSLLRRFVSINKIQEKSGISVYPNPAHDRLTIKSDQRIDQIILSEMSTGRILYSKLLNDQSAVISLSGVSKGVYILTAIHGKTKSVVRVMVQ